ncbi:hypothetical protein BDK51DRAFT_40108 [Blyttiomyces helicus]|uniref:Uncharacterized protein n=1 Tax=Blyttiomyces helicus TaxID=388810 RepID=A0A4P9WMS1_9FUNG|nr:hypothetical protein BDK51DRAFT_40108 [Blyttiomyces helicus]|eukprot:RKO92490.1 hypothetical protein BDK51DRAFT_40108 [Blyttiomyces helicus]
MTNLISSGWTVPWWYVFGATLLRWGGGLEGRMMGGTLVDSFLGVCWKRQRRPSVDVKWSLLTERTVGIRGGASVPQSATRTCKGKRSSIGGALRSDVRRVRRVKGNKEPAVAVSGSTLHRVTGGGAACGRRGADTDSWDPSLGWAGCRRWWSRWQKGEVQVTWKGGVSGARRRGACSVIP